MTDHIRDQLSPYCITVRKVEHYRGVRYDGDCVVQALRYKAFLPHGRYDDLSIPDTIWGVDRYGYNDFDDYHLALYGA